MDNLRNSRLDAVLLDVVKARGPLLGICLGHQLLFSESEEYGRHEGLDLIPGVVRRFPVGITVPHMGWNEVKQRRASPLFEGIADGAFFYFAHSYYVMPEDDTVAVGATDYEGDFASAVASGAVFGTQFHPEKSGPVGLALLENFCRLSERG
jgi:glutamine amidotransferase